jgi:hypothetical protein
MQELPDDEEETTDIQADVQDAIDNLEHINQIESGLDEAATSVIVLEGASADHQKGELAASEQEEQVFHDATAHEAGLEQEIARLPDATVTASTTGLSVDQYTQMGGSSDDADAEGEIDMDLGDDDGSEQPLPATVPTYAADNDNNIDPALLEMTADAPSVPPALVSPQAATTVTPTSNTSTPIPAAPQSTSNIPFTQQRQRDNRSASPVRPAPTRRRPGQQRRSPSYSLDAAPAVINPIPTPIPTNPIVPPGPRAGLPVKPVTGPTPSAQLPAGRRNEPRHYAPRFSFEGVEFPEGIQVTSPSVMAHQALASSWVESESPSAWRDPAFEGPEG